METIFTGIFWLISLSATLVIMGTAGAIVTEFCTEDGKIIGLLIGSFILTVTLTLISTNFEIRDPKNYTVYVYDTEGNLIKEFENAYEIKENEYRITFKQFYEYDPNEYYIAKKEVK